MTEIKEIPIDQIKVGEHDQRLKGDDDGLDGLAASIGSIGIISPLVVSDKGDYFQLVAGHRRLLAAARAGLSTAPCVILDSDNDRPIEVTFAENYFRKDLTPIELACAIADCIESETLSVEELAKGFYRSENWVRGMVAIKDWPGDVQQAVHNGRLSVSAASNLAVIDDDNYRQFLLETAVDQGATARTTSAWLQGFRSMKPADEAVNVEPAGLSRTQVPQVPSVPCFVCAVVFPMDRVSHVPMCGECITAIRSANVGKQE